MNADGTTTHLLALSEAQVTLCGIVRPPSGWLSIQVRTQVLPSTDGVGCRKCVEAMRK